MGLIREYEYDNNPANKPVDEEESEFPTGFQHWSKEEQNAYLDVEHLLPGPICSNCKREINQYHEKFYHEPGEKASAFYPGSPDEYFHEGECPTEEDE